MVPGRLAVEARWRLGWVHQSLLGEWMLALVVRALGAALAVARLGKMAAALVWYRIPFSSSIRVLAGVEIPGWWKARPRLLPSLVVQVALGGALS